ncbi:MAG: PEGA domain-containing protein [SAR324 cluster bacterium]|nr:PEGA domain-containing protein [SAR324 cluster bacterium]
MKPLQADLQVHSTPSAEIYIDDGTYMGTTPMVLKLSMGEHQLELRRKEYQTTSKTVVVQPFILNKIEERLISLPEIEFTSIPSGAAVYMDDRWLGLTPLKIKSEPGKKELMFNLAGYQQLKKTVTVKEHGTNRVEARLLELVWLYINYSPPSASVIIDGEQVNKTEENDLDMIDEIREVAVKVTTGTHQIRVTHPEAETDKEVEINLKEGENSQNVKLVLQLKQSYLNERYDDKFYQWMAKFGGSLAGAAIEQG